MERGQGDSMSAQPSGWRWLKADPADHGGEPLGSWWLHIDGYHVDVTLADGSPFAKGATVGPFRATVCSNDGDVLARGRTLHDLGEAKACGKELLAKRLRRMAEKLEGA